MTATNPGVARARPQATDLDWSGLSKQPIFSFGTRARAALHLMQAPGMLTQWVPLPETVEAIQAARASGGVPSPTQSCWFDPSERLEAANVRGIAWTSFPVVGTPRFTAAGSFPAILFATEPSTLGSASMASLAGRIDAVIVHLPADWDARPSAAREKSMAWLYHANVVAGALAGEVDPILVTPDGNVVGGLAELGALARDIAPWMRFTYSYALNFNAMGYRLLDIALAAPDPEAYAVYAASRAGTTYTAETIHDLISRSLPARGDWSPNGRSITSPLAVQTLYALRRRGGVRPSTPLRDGGGRPWQIVLVDPEGDTGPMWRGTGRYAPRPLQAEDVTRSVGALADFQLLRFSDDGETLVPSRAGESFLDLLHPSFEDADLMCRWGDYPLDGKAQEAMDAWIARSFRKLKTRVNGLPKKFRHPPADE